MVYLAIFLLLIKLYLLEANSPPPPTIVAVNYTKIIAGRFQFNCYVNSSGQLNITWYQNGEEIQQVNYQQTWDETLDKQYSVFHLVKDYAIEGGRYTCSITNQYGGMNYTIIFHKQYDEKCAGIEKPGVYNFTIFHGDNLSLVCTMLHAERNHGSYIIQSNMNTTNNTLYSITTTFSSSETHRIINYTIVNARTEDTGRYACFYNMTSKQSPDCVAMNKTFNVVVKGLQDKTDRRKTLIYLALGITLALVFVGLGLLFVVCYLQKSKLKSDQFYDNSCELRWDVFISYSSKDFQWVKQLCNMLEQPPFNLVVCVHQRDWELGLTVHDNMTESVYCSYKTLLILSKNYVQSTFCMEELRLAISCESSSKKKHRDRILVIKIDDVSLKKLPRTLKQKSYLDFSNIEERQHFKNKLEKALPHRDMVNDVDDSNDGHSIYHGDTVPLYNIANNV